MRSHARSLLLLLVAAACHAPTVEVPTLAPRSGPLADITVLASPEFGGRERGTAGNDSAAVFLGRRYESLHLRPAFGPACAEQERCPASYYQFFDIAAVGSAHNVGAVVEGRDSTLRSEYVVIGAHFDHLGKSPRYSRDEYAGNTLRPGADDNASGTAAVLELAARLGNRPTRRSVLLLDFDAEEEGMLGSQAFLVSKAYRVRDLKFMLNLDMIGRLHDNRLEVQGLPDHSVMHARIDSVARAAGLQVLFERDAHRSDQTSFADAGVPIAMFTTGEHADYHTARDVASRINGPGLLTIIDVAESIVRWAADE
jgi:hypothetical protein